MLHTVVPDHWVPITVIARRQGWSKREVARAAFIAGTGHVLSTLLIGLMVWIAGAAFATKFGTLVSTVSSIALIAFGGWIACSSLRSLKSGTGHGHRHSHGHGHGHGKNGGFHGPELARITADHDLLELSIYETGMPPRFRLSGHSGDRVWLETIRDGGARRRFAFVDRGAYWESVDEIPEPHSFEVRVSVAHGDRVHSYDVSFTEHGHEYGERTNESNDALYMPISGAIAVLAQHSHAHRHGRSSVHMHLHDHGPDSWHEEPRGVQEPPLHAHRHKRSLRTTMLLILGSSPMVEGIPAFFAAGKYGPGLIAVMAGAFAFATIATYVGLCVASLASLQRISLGPLERYGEVLSGAFIALVGLVFLVFPVL